MLGPLFCAKIGFSGSGLGGRGYVRGWEGFGGGLDGDGKAGVRCAGVWWGFLWVCGFGGDEG